MVDDCLAVLNDYEWTCENKEVEEFLNAMTQHYAPGTRIVDIEATIYSTLEKLIYMKIVEYAPTSNGGDDVGA